MGYFEPLPQFDFIFFCSNPCLFASYCQGLTARLMDSRENKVEMAGEEGQLEPLVITEEGETNFVQKETTFAQNHSKESFMKEEEKHKGEEKSEMCSEEKNLETQPVKTESDQGKVVEDEMEKKGDDLPDETEISADRQNVENQVEEAVENKENPEKSTEAVEDTVAQTEPQLVMKRLNISDHREEVGEYLYNA